MDLEHGRGTYIRALRQSQAEQGGVTSRARARVPFYFLPRSSGNPKGNLDGEPNTNVGIAFFFSLFPFSGVVRA